MDKQKSRISKEELHLMNEAGYSNKAIHFYINQTNVGKLTHPDAVSTCLGPCGDLIRLYLAIENDRIKTAKFFYLGCPGLATSVSAMTILLIGRSLEEANKLTEEDILFELGNVPQSKNDCLKLSIKSLKKTILEYDEIKKNLNKY